MAAEYPRNAEGIHDIRKRHAELQNYIVLFADGTEIELYTGVKEAFALFPFWLKRYAGQIEALTLMGYPENHPPSLLAYHPHLKAIHWPEDRVQPIYARKEELVWLKIPR